MVVKVYVGVLLLVVMTVFMLVIEVIRQYVIMTVVICDGWFGVDVVV